jgi:hypothetical protein
MEMDYGHKADMYDLAVTKMNNDSEYKDQVIELGKHRLINQDEDNKLQLRRFESAEEGKAGLAQVKSQMMDEGWYPGKKGYEAEFARRTAPFLHLVPNQLWVSENRTQLAAHNQNANLALNNYKMRKRSLEDEISATLYHGTPVLPDLNPIMYPGQLEKVTEGGSWSPFNWGAGAKDTGKVKIPQPAGGDDVIVAAKTITDFRKRWDDLKKEEQDLGQPVERADLGVFIVEPAPKDPITREQNKVYQTPKGNFRWVNGQWVPP